MFYVTVDINRHFDQGYPNVCIFIKEIPQLLLTNMKNIITFISV